MKMIVDRFVVVMTALLLLSCDKECPGRVDDSDSGDYPKSCNEIGQLQHNLYAIVYSVFGDTTYRIAIGDTAVMKGLSSAWMPYVCNDLPDSLKEEGLELLVDINVKSLTTRGENYAGTIDLVRASYLSKHLEDDPRNGTGVTSANILISPFAGNLGGYVIKSADDWQEFSTATGASMATPLNFDAVTLLGYKEIVGGCWLGGHFTFREFLNLDDGHSVLRITTKSYGLCQVGYVRWHWVTVPKLGDDEIIEFEYEEVIYD